ncbi:MAG TPA: AraC family transcriptional regulator [Terriglobia bacterium]|nr:AraC family transcriptional regulator [Terriglobia bacterium]
MSDFRPIHVSTDDLPRQNRPEAIRDFFGRMLQRMDYAPLSEQGFLIEAQALPLPGIIFGNSRYNALQVERTPDLLSDGRSDIALSIVSEGCRYAASDGSDFEVAPGDILLWSLDRRFKLTLPRAHNISATLQLPRCSLSGLVDHLDDRMARPLSARMPELQLAFKYAHGLEANNLSSPAIRQAIADHLIDLVALTLGARSDALEQARKRGVRAARLAAAKAEIRARLDDPVITPSEIAARLRITSRYLHMLFEGEGVTFAEFVTDQKLGQAYRALRRPGNVGRRIIDIAFDAGFADIRTFNRAFRRRYGMTPSEARTQAPQ